MESKTLQLRMDVQENWKEKPLSTDSKSQFNSIANNLMFLIFFLYTNDIYFNVFFLPLYNVQLFN